MRKFRIIFCTLFAAVITAGMCAVSAFAEIYVKTAAIPDSANKFAEEIWEKDKLMMQLGMEDKNKALAVKLEKGFLVTGLGRSSDHYLYPVTCEGEIMALVSASEKSKQAFFNFDFGFGSLVTSADCPAEIYDVDGIYFAVIGGKYYPIEEYKSGYKSSKTEINAAVKIIKEYRKENPSNGEYINVYGFSKGGWRTSGGNKYFIKKNGSLAKGWQTIGGDKYYFNKSCAAVTKDTTIKGKRYRFDADGKYLGTYTGFFTSGGNRYYYKKGVKQTGDFTVNGKTYHADKNGVISE